MTTNYTPDVINFAYQIIELHEQNIDLKREVKHYKEMHKLNSQTINRSIESSYETIGMCISACLDPKSSINT